MTATNVLPYIVADWPDSNLSGHSGSVIDPGELDKDTYRIYSYPKPYNGAVYGAMVYNGSGNGEMNSRTLVADIRTDNINEVRPMIREAILNYEGQTND